MITKEDILNYKPSGEYKYYRNWMIAFIIVGVLAGAVGVLGAFLLNPAWAVMAFVIFGCSYGVARTNSNMILTRNLEILDKKTVAIMDRKKIAAEGTPEQVAKARQESIKDLATYYARMLAEDSQDSTPFDDAVIDALAGVKKEWCEPDAIGLYKGEVVK